MLAAKEASEQNCAEAVIPHPTSCVTSNWLKVGGYVESASCVLSFFDVIYLYGLVSQGCADLFPFLCKAAAARKQICSQGHFINGFVMSHLNLTSDCCAG